MELTPVAGRKQARRLEGDDLFTWAKLIGLVEQKQRELDDALSTLRGFALTVGPQRYGMDPQTEVVNDAGYIVPAASVTNTLPGASQQSQEGSGAAE